MQCHESVDIKPIPNAAVSAAAAAKAAGHAIDAERCCQADGLAAIDNESLNVVVANAAVVTECDNVAVTDGDGWS
jgi:hypothetical protein